MKTITRRMQAGLSLVELMIAMLLSLLLIGGVLQIFLSSKQTYSSNVALSQVQESGRYALDFLTYDLRNAGYKGECVSPLNNLTGLTDDRYTLDMGLQGWDNSQSDPPWFTNGRKSGTDIILLKHAVNSSGAIPSTASTSTSITTTAATGIASGILLILSDPLGCDMFSNASAPADSSVSLPTGSSFGHIYPSTSEILKFQSTVYYIKDNDRKNPTLWRVRYIKNSKAAETAEELVEGIQNLQIKYAFGDINGSITGSYVDAQSITDWSKVISAQIILTVTSIDANNPMTRTFTSTVGIRNRLP